MEWTDPILLLIDPRLPVVMGMNRAPRYTAAMSRANLDPFFPPSRTICIISGNTMLWRRYPSLLIPFQPLLISRLLIPTHKGAFGSCECDFQLEPMMVMYFPSSQGSDAFSRVSFQMDGV